MEESAPPKKKCRTSRPVDRRQIARVPRGYANSPDFPVLMLEEDEERCPHCFCRPCVISEPPYFLRGSRAVHIGNRSKQYHIYKFWQMLGDIGLWYHPECLVRKEAVTERDDPQDVMPECVKLITQSYQNKHELRLCTILGAWIISTPSGSTIHWPYSITHSINGTCKHTSYESVSLRFTFIFTWQGFTICQVIIIIILF